MFRLLNPSFTATNYNINRNNTVNTSKPAFKGYYGDQQPLKKLFYNMAGRSNIYEDIWTKQHLYNAGFKRWINAHPAELLKRSAEQALQSIFTVAGKYAIPSCIPTPNYGDKWGRRANYIEINPRAIAKYSGGRVSEGLLQTMKLLPAIPPSPNSFANCIILSQLYPTHWGDGTTYSDCLYCVDLHKGISQTLTSENLFAKMGADEQVKAFNDAAHLLGFKTGFRMPISAGQIRVQGRDFNWYNHEKAYLDACKWGIELGFDSIYFDSAKHIIDLDGYCGVGALPNKDQMAYILHELRYQTGKHDLAFIGEKCNDLPVFKEMGFTAGTDWGKADNIEHVKWEARKQKYSPEYAGGPEVSNDNDLGEANYSTRLNRINSCLFGYDHIGEKLPSFMQINDIFPLNPSVNTKALMMRTIQMGGSSAWTECERHWDSIFNSGKEGNNYREKVYAAFANFINTKG